MKTAQRPTIRERAERICNVALSLPWCQPRLRLRCTHPCKKIGANGKVPEAGETVREHLTLVVAAFAKSSGRERHRHERGALALHVGREAQCRHPTRHRRRDGTPAVVLERVDDRLRRSAGEPEGGTRRTNVRRKQRAPRAARRRASDVDGMTTSVAARAWQLGGTQPARAADEIELVAGTRALAHGTRGREQEIEQRPTRPAELGPEVRSAAGRSDRQPAQRPDAAQCSARHMAPRSGTMPNHRSKESAPCSTSIPSPSAARCPASRAARTHAVSFAR